MLTEEEIVEYKEAFDLFDLDSTGEWTILIRWYQSHWSWNLQTQFFIHTLSPEGTIDFKEIGPVMRFLNYNPSTKEINEMLSSINMTEGPDGDFQGEIDFDTFVYFMTSMTIDSEEELRSVFGIFDSDNSGSISKEEFVSIMLQLGQNLTDAEVNAMLRAVDENNDGEISFQEFKNMMVSFHVPYITFVFHIFFFQKCPN